MAEPVGRGVRLGLWTAATLVVVVVAVLAWRSSDAAATSSTTAAAPVPATSPLAERVGEAWSADHGGATVAGGRVVLPGPDGVSVVDPTTGDEAWHYTRSGARLCGTTAVDQVVVVLFSTGGRCNELTALRAATGERLWYRSVGFRADATLSSTDRIVLATSPTGLATVDPTGNNIRWHHAAPDGCRILGADAGSAGVAALQDCGGRQEVVLLDGFDGSQRWVRDLGSASARLAGADGLVGVVVGDALEALAPADGATLSSTALAAGDDEGPLLQSALDTTALVWARGTAYALDTGSGTVRWSVPAAGLPAAGDVKAASGTVLVAEDDAFVVRDATTGTETGRSAVDAGLPDGVRVAVVGDVVVLSGRDLVTAYR